VGVSAYRRIGVATRRALRGVDRAYRAYRNTLIHLFRAGSTIRAERSHADTPIRRYADTLYP